MAEEKLRANTVNLQQEVENTLGTVRGFWSLKAQPLHHTSNPSQTDPPTEEASIQTYESITVILI